MNLKSVLKVAVLAALLGLAYKAVSLYNQGYRVAKVVKYEQLGERLNQSKTQIDCTRITSQEPHTLVEFQIPLALRYELPLSDVLNRTGSWQKIKHFNDAVANAFRAEKIWYEESKERFGTDMPTSIYLRGIHFNNLCDILGSSYSPSDPAITPVVPPE